MNGSYIDRARARQLMAAAGIDALILLQPESIPYATGASAGPATLFRRAGAAVALVPADPGLTLAAVMPDLAAGAVRAQSDIADVRYHRIWVDTASVRPHDDETPLGDLLVPATNAPPRPATFDARTAFLHLRDQLQERGLLSGRLGVEFEFVPAADLALLKAALPEAVLVDGSAVMNRLRMVKSPREIDLLRGALEVSEVGLAATIAAIAEGVPKDDLSAAYTDTVKAEAKRRGVPLSDSWDYISVGPDPWGVQRPVARGSIVKIDIGCVVRGYSSDCARTVAFGHASRAARELHAALLAGLEAGLAALAPGVPLRDVHRTMLATIRAAGVPSYTRGHFGHGLGHNVFSEEWPFIAADSEIAAEPGMVLAVEAPFYVDGLGGFIVEDQILVTPSGNETMNRLPRDFRII